MVRMHGDCIGTADGTQRPLKCDMSLISRYIELFDDTPRLLIFSKTGPFHV